MARSLKRSWLTIVATVAISAIFWLSSITANAKEVSRLIRSSDGTAISVQEYGARSQPTILLVHGFLQSHLAWERQIGPLERQFHVVTFDLRGHGESDKPRSAASYREGWRFADDIAAVLRETESKHPILVGWSMGARVMMDYVTKYGDSYIDGFVFVSGGLVRRPEIFHAEHLEIGKNIANPNLTINIGSTISFLRACFAVQPSQDAFARMLAYNMLVPPDVRTFMSNMPMEYSAQLSGITRPTLIIHGEKDSLLTLEAAKYIAGQVKGSTLKVYPGVGHTSFYENSQLFNSDLVSFANQVARK